jgi:hypothetical protein
VLLGVTFPAEVGTLVSRTTFTPYADAATGALEYSLPLNVMRAGRYRVSVALGGASAGVADGEAPFVLLVTAAAAAAATSSLTGARPALPRATSLPCTCSPDLAADDINDDRCAKHRHGTFKGCDCCAAVAAARAGDDVEVPVSLLDRFGNAAAVAAELATVLQVSAAPRGALAQDGWQAALLAGTAAYATGVRMPGAGAGVATFRSNVTGTFDVRRTAGPVLGCICVPHAVLTGTATQALQCCDVQSFVAAGMCSTTLGDRPRTASQRCRAGEPEGGRRQHPRLADAHRRVRRRRLPPRVHPRHLPRALRGVRGARRGR